MDAEKQKRLVSAEEEQDISRKMMIWANSFSDDDIPAATINYEFLAADSASMALSTIQGAYITRKFILGGHEAEYQFKIIARIKPGNSNDKRLKCDAMLNRFGVGPCRTRRIWATGCASGAWKLSAARPCSPGMRTAQRIIKF